MIIKAIEKIFMCPKKREQKEKDAREQVKKQYTKYETFNKGDSMDYDGMGDWGRFPPIKK